MKNQNVIQIMACFKGEFTLDSVLLLTGLKATELLRDINDATRKEILVETRAGVYRFRDENQRHEIEQGIDEQTREQLRDNIIDIMKSEAGEDRLALQELSRQLMEIDNDIDGCRRLVEAGDMLNRNADYDLAKDCYIKVIDSLRPNKEEAACLPFIETTYKLLNMAEARHDSDWASAALREALDRAVKIRHLPFQALLKMHLAINLWLRGEGQNAIDVFDDAWGIAQEIDDPRFLRPITTTSAVMSYWQGKVRRTVEIYEHSVQDVDTFPNGNFPLYAATTVAHSYASIGRVSHGLGMLDAIYTHAVKIGRHNLVGYAVFTIAQIMLQIGLLDEAHQYLLSMNNEGSEKYEERLRADILLLTAFVLHARGDTTASKRLLEDFFSLCKEAGFQSRLNAYLLYLSWEAEQGRYPTVRGLSLHHEIEMAINGKQLFFKGLAFRFKARLLKKQGADAEEVSWHMDQSLKCLLESGVELEIARTQFERARHFLDLNLEEAARQAAIAGLEIFEKYQGLEIPEDLQFLSAETSRPENLLEEILKLGQDIVTIRGERELAKYIISTITRITGAERGAIFLVTMESGRLEFTYRYTKNLTEEDIASPAFEPHMDLIRDVVNSTEGIIRKVTVRDCESYPSFGAVRSCICVPMIVQERIVGVLYNDNRFLDSAFKESDLSTFTYFAALTAIAIDNARAYDEIQRFNQNLEQEKQYYREQHLDSMRYDNFVGKSRVINNLLMKAKQVGEADTTVLITGETGVGKELIAGIILDNSKRREKPFICVNCSAFSKTLIASELFGHEKGAFTGANEQRKGRFELADGGTLFLDEIGDIPMEVQVRLLRVLQTKKFERVGGTRTLQSDFRLIAATNQNLESMVKAGRFREDLYYRLNVFPIKVPPLRKRREDIPLLALFFLKKYAEKTGKPFTRISDTDIQMLEKYRWPGNVRELENVIERAVVMSPDTQFRIPSLDDGESAAIKCEETLTMAEMERRYIIQTLNKTNWKIRGKGGAAELLGMNYSTLRSRIKKHGIKKESTAV